MFEKLAIDENKNVRGCVAENHNTPVPIPILEKLAEDESNDKWVRHDSHETLGKISGAVYSDARKRKNVSFSIRETSR